MKVKITLKAEIEFDNLDTLMSFDEKNHVIGEKFDKLIDCGGAHMTEYWWEEV